MTRKWQYTTNTLENIFIDLNVIVDIILERPGYEAFLKIIELSDSPDVQTYISSHIVTTFAYLLENAKLTNLRVRQYLEWMLATFLVIPVDQIMLSQALNSRIMDYEDAVVEQAALSTKSSYIITRNIKDFKYSKVIALTPEKYLKLYYG